MAEFLGRDHEGRIEVTQHVKDAGELRSLRRGNMNDNDTKQYCLPVKSMVSDCWKEIFIRQSLITGCHGGSKYAQKILFSHKRPNIASCRRLREHHVLSKADT